MGDKSALNFNEIEKIFGARFGNNSGEKPDPKIYDPKSGLSLQDQLLAREAIDQATPIKEKDPSLLRDSGNKENPFDDNSFVYMSICIADELKKIKSDPEKIGRIVAKTLNDLDNLPQYQIQAYERKLVYIQRCLRITLKAVEEGKIKKEKRAAYYWGICRVRDGQLETLKKYRNKAKKKTPVAI